MSTKQKTVIDALAAIATTERVSDALSRYPQPDRAIELLADEVAIQRRQLVDDLRAQLQPHTRAALRSLRHEHAEVTSAQKAAA
jgi:hypothetical protein